MLAGGLLGAGYICGIVVLDHAAEPWLYAAQRFGETVLGVVVAWGVSFVPKLMIKPRSDGARMFRSPRAAPLPGEVINSYTSTALLKGRAPKQMLVWEPVRRG